MFVFLFTDIEGSSTLWEEHTEAMTAVIARHDEILQRTVSSAGGRITKHTGDGITAVFQTAGQPLACALEAQKRFATEPWGEIGELRIRAGLHAGEAEFLASAGTAEGDYFGPPVNATARVMSAAWGGQILLTPEVTQVSPLPEQATLRDLGQHLLKNVRAPQRLYQLLHPQLRRHEFPPPRTLSGQSIREAVDQRGRQMAGLEPQAMGISLLSATLLPALQGELDPESGALEGNLGVLEDLGAVSLRRFVAGFAEQLQVDRPLPAVELQALLQRELETQWQAGGETALNLRADASRLLQAVQGVEAAMAAATGEIKEALASGLAGLGTQFGEFRWMLAGVQDTLAELRARQALQLALQREQLDLQRQQLVKTNLLLHRQRPGPTVAELTVAGEIEDIPPADVSCPYKGLAAFDADDAEYFFGREELVAELTARLAGTRFLAVVGPSGSGKSSLVRAGLLPAVWGDALPGSEDWQTLVLTPGAHPLEELAVRIALMNGYTAGALLRELEQDHRSLHLAIKQALANQPEEVRLLLVVDQLEEIFALCHDHAERGRFIDALLYAVEADDGPTIVLPTVRADFYGRCADYPGLAARMSDSLLVGPMSETELRQAIEQPAAVVGLHLEPGLAQMILDDVAGEPGALPLMSHALLETYQRRRGRTLTVSGYSESGGVAGAIAQTADTVFEAFDTGERALARSIFLRLTQLGEEGSQDTRRRVVPAELVRSADEAPRVEALLKRLADARLVITGQDTVEVAHEALIREWPLLRGWLEEDREGLRIHRHLTEAAQEWERLGREEDELYRGARLAAAGEWQASHSEALNPLEREFLDASRKLAEQEQAEREAQQLRELEAARVLAAEQQKLAEEQEKRADVEQRRAEEQAQSADRLRRRALLLAGAMAVVVILAIVALLAFRQAQGQTRLANARELAGAAQASLEEDIERSILLAIEAVESTRPVDGVVLPEALSALHQAVNTSRLLFTLPHGSSTAYSPDGTRLATCGDDGTAKVWDLATRRVLYTLAGHSDDVLDVAFSPDGSRLATTSIDRTARVWDAETGQELLTLVGRDHGFFRLAFSPDGTRLATTSFGDGSVFVWDPTTGVDLLTLQGHYSDVYDTVFSPDGQYLVTAGWDFTAKVWDAKNGQELFDLYTGDDWVTAVDFSPDGSHLATALQTLGVVMWDWEDSLATGKGEQVLTMYVRSGFVESIGFSPDGTQLATGNSEGTLQVWDSASGRELLTQAAHTNSISGLAFSPDGMQVASSSADGTTKVWDLTADGSREWRTLTGFSVPINLAFSPDGHLFAVNGLEGKTTLMDPASGEELLQLTHPTQVWAIAFSPDGQRFALTFFDGTVGLWELMTGEDGLSAKELYRVQHSDFPVWGLAFSSDGTRLATGGDEGTVKVWDASEGRELLAVDFPSWINALALSPDGTSVAAAGLGAARIWDASSGEELQVLAGHTRSGMAEAPSINDLTYSPDGKRLATAGWDGKARIWDAASGEHLLTLSGHSGWLMRVEFSPDGKSLATTSNDGTARLWDATTGEELFTLTGHTQAAFDVVFSPDGRHLATSGWDGTVRFYVLPVEELLEIAKARLTRSLTAEECQQFLHLEQCP